MSLVCSQSKPVNKLKLWNTIIIVLADDVLPSGQLTVEVHVCLLENIEEALFSPHFI